MPTPTPTFGERVVDAIEQANWESMSTPAAWNARAQESPLDRRKRIAAIIDAKHAAEVARLREREEHFARVLGVADGGQYRADWDAAITAVIEERDRLREALKAAHRAMLSATQAPACEVDCDQDDGIWPDIHAAIADAEAALTHAKEPTDAT